MKTVSLIVAVILSLISMYFAFTGKILEAILFMTYAIYNKLDTKE